MTVQEILHQFERGQTTTGLVLNVLSQPSKQVVAETLETLPASLLKEIRKFVGYYNPKKLVIRGPRPKMGTVQFVRDWFVKTGNSRIRHHFVGADQERFPSEARAIRTLAVGTDPDFRDLQDHASSVLRGKGYSQLEKKGSVSWSDPAIKSRYSAVRFKLSKLKDGIFFGVREEWASILFIPLKKIGARSYSFQPSPVRFRGTTVTNTPEGRRRIGEIVGLFPAAAEVKQNGHRADTRKSKDAALTEAARIRLAADPTRRVGLKGRNTQEHKRGEQ